jgi:hypothetical protein
MAGSFLSWLKIVAHYPVNAGELKAPAAATLQCSTGPAADFAGT